jgi:Replication-relaxation
MTQQRLWKLKSAGLITERKRKAYEPAVLSLTAKAIKVLREQSILDEYPKLPPSSLERRSQVSALTLNHELEVMDAKAAFHVAVRKTSGFAIEEFSTWPLLHQFVTSRSRNGGDVLIKPDGFIRIHEKEADGGVSEHSLFLELDRSSQTQDMLAERAGSYLEHYRSGGFAVESGATRAQYKEYPFRALFIFKNAERRNNMAERLLRASMPILTLVYLSTFDEVKGNPLGPVWMRPLDYREAARGTPFDPSARREQFGYKRQTAREIFVEGSVKKVPLLDPQ